MSCALLGIVPTCSSELSRQLRNCSLSFQAIPCGSGMFAHIKNEKRTHHRMLPLDSAMFVTYHCHMERHTSKILHDAITFDDVLLIPARSDFIPADADT